MNKLEGVILDWAGTAVDFGCFAPVNVFVDIFKHAGVEVTIEEAREPMGMLKIDHIRAMLNMTRIGTEWEEVVGRPFNEQDVEKLYVQFEQALMVSLGEYTDPIPEVTDTVQKLRNRGLKIGSTTGYTQSMIEVVASNAQKKGYAPDYYCTPDATNSYGRPYPYMIYRNMEALKLSAAWKVLKVGDTASDIQEAVNAGVWAVGSVIGSSEMGLSLEEFNALSKEEAEACISRTEQRFIQQGADFTIRSMGQLPQLIETINEQIAAGKKPGCKA